MIVIGVLIALSAEQAVEWLHWRGQVRHCRAACKKDPLSGVIGA